MYYNKHNNRKITNKHTCNKTKKNSIDLIQDISNIIIALFHENSSLAIKSQLITQILTSSSANTVKKSFVPTKKLQDTRKPYFNIISHIDNIVKSSILQNNLQRHTLFFKALLRYFKSIANDNGENLITKNYIL